MDKIGQQSAVSGQQSGVSRAVLLAIGVLVCGAVVAGCTTPKVHKTQDTETINDQLDAARKVINNMGGPTGNREVSRDDLKRTYRDFRRDPEARDAAQKILGGTSSAPAVKYSPVTGRHYSGDLEYEPETGVKLLPLPE